jgi:hypothetical protein
MRPTRRVSWIRRAFAASRSFLSSPPSPSGGIPRSRTNRRRWRARRLPIPTTWPPLPKNQGGGGYPAILSRGIPLMPLTEDLASRSRLDELMRALVQAAAQGRLMADARHPGRAGDERDMRRECRAPRRRHCPHDQKGALDCKGLFYRVCVETVLVDNRRLCLSARRVNGIAHTARKVHLFDRVAFI